MGSSQSSSSDNLSTSNSIGSLTKSESNGTRQQINFIYEGLNEIIKQKLSSDCMITSIMMYKSPVKKVRFITEGICGPNILPDSIPVQLPLNVLLAPFHPNNIYKALVNIASFIQTIAYHLQIIVEIQKCIYMVISFGQDCLQVQIFLSQSDAATRRNKNKCTKRNQVLIPISVLKQFIINHENDQYNIKKYNCKDYANALWEKMNNYK